MLQLLWKVSKMLQSKGTWMKDDDKGVFSCVDGLRPVIMLIERIDIPESEEKEYCLPS